MSGSSIEGKILIVGSEPAALAACFKLLECGLSVEHVYSEPFGLRGSSRDIGLAYPELGEPYERLEYALGNDLAAEYHQWSKNGIEELQAQFPETVKRGSRLWVTREAQESKLVALDATRRCRPPLRDEVRLMSGAAASNYAPIDGADQAAFETHTLAFVPVKALQEMGSRLQNLPGYRAFGLDQRWDSAKIASSGDSISLKTSDGEVASGDLALIAAGFETGRLLNRFHSTLIPIAAQAFRTPPLKEKARSSVLGITASWGYERYRFDDEFRLLGCGIDPGNIQGAMGEGIVDEKVLSRLLERAAQLFTDFDGSDEDLMKWAVRYATTCDGLPILGPLPGEPRIQVAAGFSISAWSRGWHAGNALAELISRDDNTPPTGLIGKCSPMRFATLGKT